MGDKGKGLPNEIVRLVFQHVYRPTLCECAVVNKQWHATAIPLLWHVLDFRYNTISTERFLTATESVIRFGHFIRELHLDGPLWTDDAFIRLVPHLSCLAYLGVNNGTLITDMSLVPVYCHQLTSLRLFYTQLTWFPTLPRVRDLVWYVSQHQSPEWIDRFPCLERLEINTYYGSLQPAYDAIQQLPLMSLQVGAQEPLKALLGHWPHLTHLTLDPCDDLGDAALVPFLALHPHLESLVLRNSALTDTSLAAMTTLSRLELIACPKITAQGVRHLIRHSHVISVGLYGCALVVPAHFPEAAEQSEYVKLDPWICDKIRLR